LVNLVTPRGFSKDCDFVVKRRIFVSVLFGALVSAVNLSNGGSLTEMGIHSNEPFKAISSTLFLMAVLYTGPIYNCYRNREVPCAGSFWTAVKTIIAAPLIEEVLFRGIILSRLLKSYSTSKSVMLQLLFFSLPHMHHLYHEIPSYGLESALREAFLRSCYTSIFGGLSSYLFISKKSLLSPIAAHVWCNYFGNLFLPQSSEKLEIGAYTFGLIGFFTIVFNFV